MPIRILVRVLDDIEGLTKLVHLLVRFYHVALVEQGCKEVGNASTRVMRPPSNLILSERI